MRQKIFIFIFIALLGLSSYGGYLVNEINSSSTKSNVAVSPLLKNYKVSPVNVLIMVKDNESSNTDSIMCVNYKPNVGQLSLLNIPRDTQVYYNGLRCKINNIYVQEQSGLATCEKVEELLDIKIDKYAVLNLKTISKIVNKLGGVYFDVPVDMRYTDRSQNLKIRIKKGYQKLNGNQVVKVLRFRHKNRSAPVTDEYNKYYGAGSDLNRINMQHLFISAFIDQFINLNTIANLDSLLKIVLDEIETNITYNDAIKYCSKAINLSGNPIKTYRLNGVDDTNGWYYVYDNQILNTKTNKLIPGDKCIKNNFTLDEKVENKKSAKISEEKNENN